jgi:hypothetical protein
VPRAGWVERLGAMGTAAQASVPGLYAWGVTVAPGAFAHGAAGVPKAAAAVALAALLSGPLADERLGERARIPLLWIFVLSSALAWSTAPSGLAPSHVDAQRGLAGMLGWALFAITWSAPALPPGRGTGRVVEPDTRAVDGDRPHDARIYVLGGATLAAILQGPGWGAASLERALLVRVVALVAGLSVVGVATEVALTRYRTRVCAPRRARLRRGAGWLALLGLLLLVGLLFGSRG